MNNIGTVSGFGFSINNLSFEKVLLFSINHRSVLVGFDDFLDKVLCFYEIYKDSLDKMEHEQFFEIFVNEFSDYFTLFQEIEDRVSGTPGYGAIIASTIFFETGITVGFEIDDNNEVVIFYSSMPWAFNNKEKLLTERSLKDLFKPYMEELEISEKDYGFYHLVFM